MRKKQNNWDLVAKFGVIFNNNPSLFFRNILHFIH